VLASFAVLLVLSQEPPPPSAPPLVPSVESDRPVAAPLAPAEPPPEPRAFATPGSAPAPIDAHADEDRPSRAARIGGSVGAAAVGAALTTGGLDVVGNNPCIGGCASGGTYQTLAGYIVVGAGLALVWLGAWGAHRLLGGKSSLGWPLLGAIAGATAGAIGTLVFGALISPSSNTSPVWIYGLVGSALAAVGAGLMPEVGNTLAERQEQSVANRGRF
jgi:hypothetical protein